MSFNALTPGEVERLALLAEECGEVIQAIGKVLRHGYESVNPLADPHNQPTNRHSLERELGDLEFAITLLCKARDLDTDSIVAAAHAKAARVVPYLHHQGAS